MNDHEGAGDKVPLLFAVMGRLLPGPGYDEAAAADARERIVAFFDAHLKLKA
jgi:dienelactone hydrolase